MPDTAAIFQSLQISVWLLTPYLIHVNREISGFYGYYFSPPCTNQNHAGISEVKSSAGPSVNIGQFKILFCIYYIPQENSLLARSVTDISTEFLKPTFFFLIGYNLTPINSTGNIIQPPISTSTCHLHDI